MRLDFRILWVEDQPAAVAEDRTALEADLLEFGFEPIVVPISGFSDLQDLMNSNPEDDEFDLILVDYDLGASGGKGDDAARAIRDHFPHREMVFYSGKSPEELRDKAAKKKIDGVYFAHRTELADDVFSVIENMLRKVVDISHMRGIVMAETSELDYCIELCLSSAFENLDETQRKTIHDKAVKVVRERYKLQLEQLDALDHPDKFTELLGRSLLMTSRDKTRALLRFLKAATHLQDQKEHRTAVVEYQDNFHDVRNDLAHGMVIKKDGRKIFKGRNIELTEETMREWRINLMTHRDQIKLIASVLNVNFEDE